MCIIKEINMLDLNANDRQMALNEVKVLAKMDHPNIIGYHDSFERDGILMIEMEYADGGNLQEFLSKQTVRMEEKDILDILYQMVSAIQYMHAHNVLHRDLKTANIFLTREGTVKLGRQQSNFFVPKNNYHLIFYIFWGLLFVLIHPIKYVRA